MNALSCAAVLAIVALNVAPANAAPNAGMIVAPSSPWNVNYAGDSCRLTRVFGTGRDQTYVIFERFAPGQAFKLTLAGKRFGTAVREGKVTFRFGPNEAEQSPEFLAGNFGEGIPAFLVRGQIRLDPQPERSDRRDDDQTYEKPPTLSAERVAAVNELEVGRPLRRPVRFALGSMKGPFSVFDKCMNETITRWGIDVVRYATQLQPPRPTSDPRNWLSSSDYPATARMMGAQGLIYFRLNVDENGKPTACNIQQSTREKEFDAVICKAMMRRAAFKPALDKDGKAFASFYLGTAYFKMP